ncbi:hypothetical protein KC332_g4919 [Hortaea werneckii]|uniref:tRNA/rRNA methyltransferase SpoU type domain-containing protein n=2 Tax=Hortaea werneckii TaxID=91943 RepID=A0A3M7INB8_HORWE|nr:hypothetical protein KC350_g12384 [Hortaea werneckii]OTA24400.1 hypothetical protein BTJ68_12289 [Hortaea werneckii EXF-2000]KAI6939430.1 hypothetical protein KC341_g4194 [Hortaea werneckii]KAI6947565.1 hypothetical protein KC348_g2456 [Hortaea werneckii]KAI6969980.1 hypothetical protein KC321_g7568 [Hortaea werneckii]
MAPPASTSTHTEIARTLLKHVPDQERPRLIRDAVQSLGQGNSADVSFTAALLLEHPDLGLQQELVHRLTDIIEAGSADLVLPVLTRDAGLGEALLDNVISSLERRVLQMKDHWKGNLVVNVDADLNTSQKSPFVNAKEQPQMNFDALKNTFSFLRQVLASGYSDGSLQQLFDATVTCMGVSDEGTCMAARGTFSALLSQMGDMQTDQLDLLWKFTKQLNCSASLFHHGLGYSLWLLWSTKLLVPGHILADAEYWQMLQTGLRKGDGERRKQCLGIFRRSVALAVKDPSTRPLAKIYPTKSDNIDKYLGLCADIITDTNTVLAQYERFCVIFETVLLGRYLNQILACKVDLDELSSSSSAVKTEWLYTLFASALTPQVQESIRKFLGNWMIDSHFQPETTEEFANFFRDVVLPWGAQGSLFTSSIKRRDDEKLVCSHGERLVGYISRVLQRAGPHASGLVDALLNILAGRRSGSFPYASVYVLEGLAQAFAASKELVLMPHQLEQVASLSVALALPEVARDFIHVRSIKLCAESAARSKDSPGASSIVEAIQRWKRLQAELETPGEHACLGQLEPIAAWQSDRSVRDVKEMETLEKCQTLAAQLYNDAQHSPADVEALVEDIWSDVEYLEYPKKLLIKLPALFLHPRLVQVAQESSGLAELVASTTEKLRDLSQTRVYLLAPLMCSLRHMALVSPTAMDILPMQDIIAQYAERVPEPTVDLQLEVVSADLVKSIDPLLSEFGYEHYFGAPMSVGVAALLDLVGRLGVMDAALVRSIYDRLVQRWAKQKTPLPTVSAWKTTLQLQVMVLCCEQLVQRLTDHELLTMLKDLHYILSIEPLPRFRYLQSWMVARIYLKRKDLRQRIISELSSKDHHSNPKYLASLMKIGVMIAKLEDSDRDFAMELAARFVPLAASSKVVIRHEGQWQVPILMDLARARGWNEVFGSTALASLDGYIRSLERFDQPPLERQLDRFDPIHDNTMTNLVEGTWTQLDVFDTVLCRKEDFQALDKADQDVDASRSQHHSCIALGELPVLQLTLQPKGPDAPEEAKQELVPGTASDSRALQTKGTAYLASGVDESDSAEVRRNDLIVIASLVDNPYNLGGLSRVSEIFAASEMHLQNHHVTGNRDFTNVSVSSHLHFPIMQLSAPNVPEYLASKKDEGWRVVGIEQTDRSVLLGSPECKLPEKVILVIGSEKEGIPALILSECDMLVEIPQQGITRSLNVQTAAAIVLYEYTRQHRQQN